MKEIIVKIPDENVDLIVQLLKRLGAEIKEKKNIVRKPKIKESKDFKKDTYKKEKDS